MKRQLLALGITASIVFSLLAFAQPTAAVLATVAGPDQVEKPDRMTFTTAIEVEGDEGTSVDGFDLVIETANGEAVTITFSPNGTVTAVDPPRGVVGQGEIRVNRLARELTVTRTDDDPGAGYGYGYGYGYGDVTYVFEIELDSRAFKHGAYDLRVDVDTDDGTVSSDRTTVEIDLPRGSGTDDRPAERGPGADLPNDRGSPHR